MTKLRECLEKLERLEKENVWLRDKISIQEQYEEYVRRKYNLSEDIGFKDMAKAYKSEHNQKLAVRRAIERERKYQDKKWGTIEENPHPIEKWIEIMLGELHEAIEAYSEKSTEDALAEIIQTVAVGHACLEQHGIVYFRK